MAKRQPFDTHLNFPPAPTRALLSTPLDGIIGGPAARTEPPTVSTSPPEAMPSVVPEEAAQPENITPSTSMEASVSAPAPAAHAPTRSIERFADPIRDTVAARESPGNADDGKVTVKLPSELKNRLYNAIYHERATVGDYLTRAVDELMDELERERGAPYPQRPASDAKFRSGRRPS